MKLPSLIKSLLEYVGGVEEDLPSGLPGWLEGPFFWALWWVLLILLILTFCGQTSKFIYIDF